MDWVIDPAVMGQSVVDGDLSPDPPLAIPSPRWVPQLGRLRGSLPLDVVEFVAPCPACGDDTRWSAVREDTRLRAHVHCNCQH